jgi:hypothetical protein
VQDKREPYLSVGERTAEVQTMRYNKIISYLIESMTERNTELMLYIQHTPTMRPRKKKILTRDECKTSTVMDKSGTR